MTAVESAPANDRPHCGQKFAAGGTVDPHAGQVLADMRALAIGRAR